MRELENCVRRTATLARSTTIEPDDFACRSGAACGHARARQAARRRHAAPASPATAVALPVLPARTAPAPAAEASACACSANDPSITACPPPGGCSHATPKSERDRLIEAMDRCGWVQAKAARLLDLTPRQIGYALRKHGIELQRL